MTDVEFALKAAQIELGLRSHELITRETSMEDLQLSNDYYVENNISITGRIDDARFIVITGFYSDNDIKVNTMFSYNNNELIYQYVNAHIIGKTKFNYPIYAFQGTPYHISFENVTKKTKIKILGKTIEPRNFPC